MFCYIILLHPLQTKTKFQGPEILFSAWLNLQNIYVYCMLDHRMGCMCYLVVISTVLVFPHVMKMTEALLAHEIDGALVDNYVLTHSLNLIQKEPIRIERYIDHSITYGVVLPKNSSRFEKCVRSFLRNHPRETFEIIAANLVPLKVRVFCDFFHFNLPQSSNSKVRPVPVR